MHRSTFALGGTLLVAAALVVLTPGHSHAHGGGFHGGGFHAGGYHFGGYHGGYHHGGYHNRPYYGRYHYGGYRFGPYYGLYSSYPYYDPDLGSGSVYDPGYTGLYDQPAPSATDEPTLGGSPLSSGPPYPVATSATQDDPRAHITVNVPADARVWFDNTRMTSTGPAREYISPPVTPGHRYSYNLKVSWNENGHAVTQTQTVEVTAGGHVAATFPGWPKTAGQ